MLRAIYRDSPLGRLTVAADETAIRVLVMEGQHREKAHLPRELPEEETPLLLRAGEWLDAYFAGERPELCALPLAPEGTAFQKRVWDELKKIPYGRTRSYGELAAVLGTSARAVGSAVGRNPISILIPCHRVLGRDGKLTGFDGGLDRKALLLRLEGIEIRDEGMTTR